MSDLFENNENSNWPSHYIKDMVSNILYTSKIISSLHLKSVQDIKNTGWGRSTSQQVSVICLYTFAFQDYSYHCQIFFLSYRSKYSWNLISRILTCRRSYNYIHVQNYLLYSALKHMIQYIKHLYVISCY